MPRPLRVRPEAPDTIKLQKRLADAGLGSRRAMEALIQAGEVTVNGKPAQLGARVAPYDRISVAGKPVTGSEATRSPREPRVVLYHKPEGEIVSRADPEGRPSVFERVPAVKRGRWLAVGRLDFNTCGLLIFTDSGMLANRLTHPRFQVRRDYAVRVLGELTPEQIRSLRAGVTLDDGFARFDLLESQGGEGSNRWYRVSVKEGRNRLVRRMFTAVGLTVSRLMRTRFGPFELPPRLKRGQWMQLDASEVKKALNALDAGETRRLTANHRDRPARPVARERSRSAAASEVRGGGGAQAHPAGRHPAGKPRRPRPRYRAR